MANVTGSAFNDFIHRSGDGRTGSGAEIDTVTTAADVINGGNGEDLIYGDAGNDTIDGGDGNDVIVGGSGADILRGGVGNDMFRFTAASEISGLAETIDGGADLDTIDLSTFGPGAPVDLHLATITNVETLQLGGFDVTLTATQLGAFQSVLGVNAFDRIVLSAAGTVDLTNAFVQSIEEFRGTTGADTFNFTNVQTGQLINTLDGADTVFGGEGADTINGGTGADTLNGAGGGDIIIGGVAADTINGGAGDDSIRIAFVGDISGLAEKIDGGADTDTLDFQAFNATGAVDLSHTTLTSIETLALSGNDATLTAAQLSAFTTLAGTNATDRVILSGAGVADLTGATIVNIEEIRGSAGADTIDVTDVANGQFIDGRGGADSVIGGLGADTLLGGDGNDRVIGGAGNDILRGGQGIDRFSGGVGYDTFQIEQVSDISGLAEQINGGSDVDTLTFQTFNAFGAVDLTKVVFTSVENLLLTSGNDVKLTAAQFGAFETIGGTNGTERLILSAAGTVDLTGATLNLIDELRGTTGADTFKLTGVTTGQNVNGLAGADTLTGGEGADTIDGGANNDTIVGGGGADILIGGLNVDTLTGGAGNDTFRYTDLTETLTGSFRDTITDFTHGVDVLDLSGVDANTEAAGNQQWTFIGSTVFSHTAGELRYTAGQVLGDANGDGVAEFQIVLTGSPGLTASDIFL